MKRNVIFKVLYRSGLPAILRSFKWDQITILSLHRISNERDYFFNPLTPDRFKELVKYAIKYYSVLSFAELADLKKPLRRPPLLLSFDDGYSDFYEFALPILTKFGVPSNHNIVNECANNNSPIWTHRLNSIFNHCKFNGLSLEFVIDGIVISLTDFNNDWVRFSLTVFRSLLLLPKSARIQLIDNKEQQYSVESRVTMMGWKEIIECSKNGVEIGSHTYTHDVISSVTSRESLEYEIVQSKLEIEKHVQCPVQILALPNGAGNKRINDFVRNAGFKYLLYVNDATDDIGPRADESLRILNRINIVDEPRDQMILRTELFHSKVRKYV